MELKELSEKTLKIFNINNVNDLGGAIAACVVSNDTEKYDKFLNLVNDDLSKDWLQMIYQYYCADRKEKKQDYTPSSIARLCSKLIGEGAETVDLCAGSGALTIQRWSDFPDEVFELYEIDGNVIPYLLFNLIIRNVNARVIHGDVLQQEITRKYYIRKGEKYAKIFDMQPAL